MCLIIIKVNNLTYLQEKEFPILEMNVNTGEAGDYKKFRQNLELAQLWSWDNLELVVLPPVPGLLAYTTTPGLSGAGDKQGSAYSTSKHRASRPALD